MAGHASPLASAQQCSARDIWRATFVPWYLDGMTHPHQVNAVKASLLAVVDVGMEVEIGSRYVHAIVAMYFGSRMLTLLDDGPISANLRAAVDSLADDAQSFESPQWLSQRLTTVVGELRSTKVPPLARAMQRVNVERNQ